MDRFSVKKYDDGLLSVYDNLEMTYSCIIEDCEDNKVILDEVIDGLNSLNNELKSKDDELSVLKGYFSRNELELVLENIKLRNMLKYQKGVYDLEKRYFSEVLVSCIEEYPNSMGLVYFREIMGW